MNRLEELLDAIKQLRQDLELAEQMQNDKRARQFAIMKRLAIAITSLPKDERQQLIDLWVDLHETI